MKIWRPDLIIVFGSLVLGSLIYLITRSEATVLNHYVSLASDGQILATIQGLISNKDIPWWIIYSLPDALWMFAMSLSILLIWQYKILASSIAFTFLAILAGMSHEILQGLGIISGTFDQVDLAFIFIGGSLPLVFFTIKSVLANTKINTTLHTTT